MKIGDEMAARTAPWPKLIHPAHVKDKLPYPLLAACHLFRLSSLLSPRQSSAAAAINSTLEPPSWFLNQRAPKSIVLVLLNEADPFCWSSVIFLPRLPTGSHMQSNRSMFAERWPQQEWGVNPSWPRPLIWDNVPGSWNTALTPNPVTMVRIVGSGCRYMPLRTLNLTLHFCLCSGIVVPLSVYVV